MEIIQDLNKPVDDNSLDTIKMEQENQEQRPAKPEPPQPQNQPTTNASQAPAQQPANKAGKGLLFCNIVLLIGLVLIYIFPWA